VQARRRHSPDGHVAANARSQGDQQLRQPADDSHLGVAPRPRRHRPWPPLHHSRRRRQAPRPANRAVPPRHATRAGQPRHPPAGREPRPGPRSQGARRACRRA
ncbi:hypothetical protein BN1708_020101, partial [Verticillium longisporum]